MNNDILHLYALLIKGEGWRCLFMAGTYDECFERGIAIGLSFEVVEL